jgi:hypothetical protein
MPRRRWPRSENLSKETTRPPDSSFLGSSAVKRFACGTTASLVVMIGVFVFATA